MPYIFFSLLALNSAEALKNRKDLLPYALYLPLLFAAAYMTKNHGVILYLSMVAVLILRSFGRESERGRGLMQLALFAAVTVAPFIFWILKSELSSGAPFTFRSVFIFNILKGLYNMGAGVFIERVWENLGMLIVAIPGSLLSFIDLQRILPGPVFNIISLFLFFTIFSGLVYRLAVKRGVMDFYVVFYLSIITVWPVYGLGDARRYMVPLIPFIYYYSFTGFNLILSVKDISRGPMHMRGYMLIPFALFLVLNVFEIRDMFRPGKVSEKLSGSVSLLKRDLSSRYDEVRPETVLKGVFLKTRPCYYDYMLNAHILKELSRPGDLILTRKPELVALITGSYAMKFPYTDDGKVLMKFIDDKGVDYILLDGCFDETRKFLIPFVEKYSDRFSVWVHEDKNTGILKLVRE
jgi:hypothetical protein